MAKVNIQKVAAQIASKHRLSQKEAEDFVSMAFSTIGKGLDTDGLVKVKGLGTFKIIDVRERESVNVNTGERVTISGHGKISFTPDTVIKDLINKPFAQFETVVINEGVDIEELNAVKTPETIIKEDTNDNTIDLDEENNKNNEFVSESEVNTNVNEDIEDVMTSDEKHEETIESNINSISQTETIVSAFQDDDIQNSQGNNDEMPSEAKDLIDDSHTMDLKDTSMSVDMDIKDEKIEEKEISSDNNTVVNEANVSNDNFGKKYSSVSEDISMDLNEDSKQKCFVGNHIWLLSLAFVFVALISLCAGYYMGISTAKIKITDGTPVKAIKQNKPSVKQQTVKSLNNSNTQNTSVADTCDTLDKTKEPNNTHTTADITDVQKKNQSLQTVPETVNTTAKLSFAQSMVRTGAYNIVGTERIITVKKGETLKRISKFYLGDGMDCYVQVHNGIEEVTEGMTLKIPLLKVKKKLKR